MKRIMNDVAVQTLLYSAPKTQLIKIVDLSYCPKWENTEITVVYEGENDLASYKWAKILASKVVGWYTETCEKGTQLVIEICTAQDHY